MNIVIPSVGESVVEALVAKWLKKSGDQVAKDDVLCELETDKITFTLQADAAGTLTVLVPEGETVTIGSVIATIAEAAVAVEQTTEAPAAGLPLSVPSDLPPPSSPSLRKQAATLGIDLTTVAGSGSGGRVTAADLASPAAVAVEKPAGVVAEHAAASQPVAVHSEEPTPYVATPPAPKPRERRVAMTPIRKRIAERLLAARQQTAMLTTFNEADLSRVMALRQKYREHYQEKFGSKPGLMPFFVKACCEALQEFPEVNAAIDGSDIVYHDYYDIGIAIGSDRGLVVPVLRDADRLRFREIDAAIEAYSRKVQEHRLVIADLEGGTFSISNGGVYGSLLSTPIINPPQSAVLGMHAIQERPVVRDGQVVVRPMMYLALSYDHRLVDGKEAVQFLRRVKELVEEPEELLLEG